MNENKDINFGGIMVVKIVCKLSKKKNAFYALVINDVYVCFDVNAISRATGVSLRDIFNLEVDEDIILRKED